MGISQEKTEGADSAFTNDAAYLTAAVGRFGLIQKLPKRWQRILSSLALIGAAFAACMFALSFINAVIDALPYPF